MSGTAATPNPRGFNPKPTCPWTIVEPTLESIYARCDEVGDCILWKGCASDAGNPLYNSKRWPSIYVRHVVWGLTRGDVPTGKILTVCCTEPRCLVHLTALTQRQAMKRAAKLGAASFTPERAMRIALKQRQRGKLDMDKARAIRASEEPTATLAKRYGVSKSLIALVRKRQAWKEGARGMSIFNL